MEATFDNRTNVLSANIRTAHDDSVIYSIKTTFGLWGRKLVTVLKDANPLPDEPVIVGAINWKDHYFEIHGHRRSLSSLKRTSGKFLRKSRYWRWSPERKEYEIKFHKDEWQVSSSSESEDTPVVGRLSVPFRPHLVRKCKPAALELKRTALIQDEVFLILLLIYLEAKRQEQAVSSI
ncbi:hypothetical protein AMATHDRAFT_147696 [Amanita thiersii Skay4041]|uniref:DUF6593 domain-containing protein n=1 Tax=Amanita thiersii Skay4041 TaxID=703135 RepID=A0A2A9NH60_9AGAR|nr:hypothetical protein AMATHDRAFT_147696 [Amanita thiersii Skay4041]